MIKLHFNKINISAITAIFKKKKKEWYASKFILQFIWAEIVAVRALLRELARHKRSSQMLLQDPTVRAIVCCCVTLLRYSAATKRGDIIIILFVPFAFLFVCSLVLS
jgi:hypothetical protein